MMPRAAHPTTADHDTNLDPDLAREMAELDPHAEVVRRHFDLSDREMEIMLAIVDHGLDTATQIGKRIGLKRRTVELYMHGITTKLKVRSKLRAALIIDRALRSLRSNRL